MERSTIFYGKTHYKWQFSIAMLNYQRVTIDFWGLKKNQMGYIPIDGEGDGEMY